jgi:hypothetical protein
MSRVIRTLTFGLLVAAIAVTPALAKGNANFSEVSTTVQQSPASATVSGNLAGLSNIRVGTSIGIYLDVTATASGYCGPFQFSNLTRSTSTDTYVIGRTGHVKFSLSVVPDAPAGCTITAFTVDSIELTAKVSDDTIASYIE